MEAEQQEALPRDVRWNNHEDPASYAKRHLRPLAQYLVEIQTHIVLKTVNASHNPFPKEPPQMDELIRAIIGRDFAGKLPRERHHDPELFFKMAQELICYAAVHRVAYDG